MTFVYILLSLIVVLLILICLQLNRSLKYQAIIGHLLFPDRAGIESHLRPCGNRTGILESVRSLESKADQIIKNTSAGGGGSIK